MKIRELHQVPADKQDKLRRAVRLEWTTIGFVVSIICVVGLVTGTSQAMKAAWIEDILSLVPSISFLIAIHFHNKPPTKRFPYGFRRAVSISFLCAALALTAFGGYLLVESALALIHQEHPSIGLIEIFGRQIWLGWLMILALLYSALPPVILGRMKLPLARELHQKTLHTDAEMNRADWLTALAGILGILGIGFGYWWADSLAAGIISLDVLKDGLTSLKGSVASLMDAEPTQVDDDSKPEELPERLRSELERFEWVKQAQLRLREEGDAFTGEAYIVPETEENLLANVEHATEFANNFDWRIYDVVVVPVRSI